MADSDTEGGSLMRDVLSVMEESSGNESNALSSPSGSEEYSVSTWSGNIQDGDTRQHNNSTSVIRKDEQVGKENQCKLDCSTTHVMHSLETTKHARNVSDDLHDISTECFTVPEKELQNPCSLEGKEGLFVTETKKGQSAERDMNTYKEHEKNITEIMSLDESSYDYILAYKFRAVHVLGVNWPDVKIRFARSADKCSQGLEITGPSDQLHTLKCRLNDIIKYLKASHFVLGISGLCDHEETVKRLASEQKCIVKIDQSASLKSDTNVIRLCKESFTSVFVISNMLELQKADVIVNTIHKNLTLGVGRVSSALFKACGCGVQQELRQKYPNGIGYGQVAETGPGQLSTCKAIYHGALPFWKGLEAVSKDKCFEALLTLVYQCLLMASHKRYTSIAFPALGTGGLSYPYIEVVQFMYSAVKMFLNSYPYTSLDEIYFIVYPSANRELKQRFLTGCVTQSANTQQLKATQVTENFCSSSNQVPEVIFHVGKTLLKVINAQVNDVCHAFSPVLVMWSLDYMQDPQRNTVLQRICPGKPLRDTFTVIVKDLQSRKTVVDTSSLSPRTLIHCYLPSNSDKDVMTTVQCGLECAQKNSYESVVMLVNDSEIIQLNSKSSTEALLKAVKKCSSCVHVVTIAIPDKIDFVCFVTLTSKIYTSETPSSVELSPILESTWNESCSSFTEFQSGDMNDPKTTNEEVLTVTSESEEKNRIVAMEIQRAVRKERSSFK